MNGSNPPYDIKILESLEGLGNDIRILKRRRELGFASKCMMLRNNASFDAILERRENWDLPQNV